jgi:inosose dehydratase
VEAGVDPVDIIRSFRDRVLYVHFKDFRDGRFVPLGEGAVDVRGVVDALGGSPGDGWWTVELNETDKDKRAVAAESLNFLKRFVSQGRATPTLISQ